MRPSDELVGRPSPRQGRASPRHTPRAGGSKQEAGAEAHSGRELLTPDPRLNNGAVNNSTRAAGVQGDASAPRIERAVPVASQQLSPGSAEPAVWRQVGQEASFNVLGWTGTRHVSPRRIIRSPVSPHVVLRRQSPPRSPSPFQDVPPGEAFAQLEAKLEALELRLKAAEAVPGAELPPRSASPWHSVVRVASPRGGPTFY
eukprot:Hpha_TRINITY_DN16673_c2_g3::TRINITY_DN16673_c2_g3_i1::g.180780::m.180780